LYVWLKGEPPFGKKVENLWGYAYSISNDLSYKWDFSQIILGGRMELDIESYLMEHWADFFSRPREEGEGEWESGEWDRQECES
jgi:hypothetical protein